MPASRASRRLLGFAKRGRLTRLQLQARLKTIFVDTRLLWMPKPTDTTTATTDDAGARTITFDATVAARLATLGRATAQSFVSASSQFGTTPDTANLSFTTGGLTDLPFSIVVLANVTDTAAARVLASKWNATGLVREWMLFVTATDGLQLILRDESAAVSPTRTSDAAITQGSWHLFAATYDGTGGATAANGVLLYADGVLTASTAANQATYVAMEDTTAPCELGSQNAHTASFLDGSLALVAVCAKALSAAELVRIAALCHSLYGVP